MTRRGIRLVAKHIDLYMGAYLFLLFLLTCGGVVADVLTAPPCEHVMRVLAC